MTKCGINSNDPSEYSLYDIFWGMPMDYPLWYLRDLICMTILTPVFYYLFSKIRLWGLILLTIGYLSTFETGISGLSSTAIMFFGVGAYLGMEKSDVIELSEKYKNIAFGLSAILLFFSIYMNGKPIHEYIIRWFVISGIISTVNIFCKIQIESILGKVFISLSSTVFFIYAVHEIYIINWLKGFYMRTFLYQYEFGKLFIYFTLPFICVGICLFLYFSSKNSVFLL